MSELPEHRSHGDYVARLEVNRVDVAADSIHFARITWTANPAGYGNTLMLNGQTMPSVSNTAYDAARVCS